MCNIEGHFLSFISHRRVRSIHLLLLKSILNRIGREERKRDNVGESNQQYKIELTFRISLV